MKKASITEAKNNLSALIDRVKGGSPVLYPPIRLVRSRGLNPPQAIGLEARPGSLLTLFAQASETGRPRSPRRRKWPRSLPATRASAVQALLDERRSGR